MPQPLWAQSIPADPEFDDILAHDIADLTIISVSRRPQKLNASAAAVYVVSKEDLQRTGVTSVADALRIVPGLQVAQINSNRWAISARGFNASTANNMLVMIDGRSLYNPVFAGTYWDDRSIPLAEIERIEVIRGPGGSIWGANAVNGIINVISKSGKDEQGSYANATVGSEEAGSSIGTGKEWKPDQYYRAYAQYTYDDATKAADGQDNVDEWSRGQAGFRFDGKANDADNYTVTGQAYGGDQDNRNTTRLREVPYVNTYFSEDHSYGGSVMGKWDHAYSPDSTGTLKASIDHYTRLEEMADQKVTTFDIDWQRDTRTSERNNFTWGLGYRFFSVGIEGSFNIRVNADQQYYHLFSAFVQDEYALVPNELFLTVGTKLERNEFTMYELQPSARLSWVMDDTQTLWGAVSRAVRTPSIIDDQINLIARTEAGPTYTVLFGSPGIESEDLTAYELGYRVQVTPKLQLDNTLYYNDYDNLVTYEARDSYFTGLTFVNPYTTTNNGYGHVYGFETAATYATSRTHRLMGSYSYAEMDLSVHAPALSRDATETLLPKHMISLRSYWNVTPTVTFDNMLYYVDNLSAPVGDYVRYDTRLGWQPIPGLELSLTGRNLLDARHAEFPTTPQSEIERSVVGSVTWRF